MISGENSSRFGSVIRESPPSLYREDSGCSALFFCSLPPLLLSRPAHGKLCICLLKTNNATCSSNKKPFSHTVGFYLPSPPSNKSHISYWYRLRLRTKGI
ncbi:hypothetical protein, unlikely [Trypanosoma brucei gambiense DAL972]|uniref:Uncharacterized protein n=1 Tax=Trypanosoma brucei gambiense (strain MHOM/CI/86/DAL972) TaxID=679716 RepID=C9ZVX8_TRYB9|nr:hypothetical protein, unlikely [Trypanosoma brucei gambiense DAL972]CBH13566.1 hypothetical protein, unlikely [Trypanosoma brucei gambiense DAL972]|eukprot:XP_011775843.1 hypothetical protein, unlikely [Trypanosoma brucei gambiense DAL972]